MSEREISDVIEASKEALVELAKARTEVERLREALEFYADPDTWFAVALFPDPPCGEIVNDIGTTEGWEEMPYERPGKRARAALAPEATPNANHDAMASKQPR